MSVHPPQKMRIRKPSIHGHTYRASPPKLTRLSIHRSFALADQLSRRAREGLHDPRNKRNLPIHHAGLHSRTLVSTNDLNAASSVLVLELTPCFCLLPVQTVQHKRRRPLYRIRCTLLPLGHSNGRLPPIHPSPWRDPLHAVPRRPHPRRGPVYDRGRRAQGALHRRHFEGDRPSSRTGRGAC